jgi:NADPH:quinone reductase-like Zn-dependent oxidoreductase
LRPQPPANASRDGDLFTSVKSSLQKEQQPPENVMTKMNAYTRSPFAFSTNYPIPSKLNLKPDQVFIRVLAASINPVDYKAPSFLVGKVVGLDLCGIVEAVGSDSPFLVGSRVYGTSRGTLAQYVLATHTSLALAPKTLTPAQAAAMPTVYLTGLQALRKYGNLSVGGRVLIIGASGGCGLAGVQLARALGAKNIVGVCSGKNKDLVLGQGAHAVVDYTVDNFWEKVEKYDVVYDTATNSGGGEDYKGHALKVLETRPHNDGQYVTINAATKMWLQHLCCCCSTGKNQHLFLTDANTKDLTEIAELVDLGAECSCSTTKDPNDGKTVERTRLVPVLHQEFMFNKANVMKGFEQLRSRRTVGKIVFVMDGGSELNTKNGGQNGEAKS